jgi:hypothetical protein
LIVANGGAYQANPQFTARDRINAQRKALSNMMAQLLSQNASSDASVRVSLERLKGDADALRRRIQAGYADTQLLKNLAEDIAAKTPKRSRQTTTETK